MTESNDQAATGTATQPTSEVHECEPLVQMIPTDRIAHGENYRRTFTGIEELAADVARRGILQPMLVRPHNGAYQLVFGARRLLAAVKAKLPAVPCIIRAMADDEALELRIIENSKREDVHPMEESEGYQWLHVKYGHSVDEIAAKVGKSKSWVYGRMKLLALCKDARDAFLAGDIDASVAVLIARIPSETIQAEALDNVRGDEWTRPLPYKEAADLIQRDFMLRLKQAPFAIDDANLVKAAGPCTTCPKRTGNQPELFDDVKSADVCTDPECFHKKRDAHNEKLKEDIEARGIKVLKPGAAKKLFAGSDHLIYGCGYVDMDRPCEFDDKKPQRPYRKLFRDLDVPVVAAENPHDNKIHELIRVEDAKSALNEIGIKPGRSLPTAKSGAAAMSPAEKRRRREEQIRKRRMELLTAAIVEQAEVSDVRAEFWAIMARFAIMRAWHDTTKRIISRRGWKDAMRKNEAQSLFLNRMLESMTSAEARGLLVEIMMGVDTQFADTETDDVRALAHLYDLKVDNFAQRARAEFKEKGKRKPKARKPKAAPKETTAAIA